MRFRPAADAALSSAIQLAGFLGGEVHVVHVVTLDDYDIDPDGEDYEQHCLRTLARERKSIDEALAPTSIPWRYHQSYGDPADALCAVADDVGAALIVVGGPPAGLLHRVARGRSTVSTRLVHLGRYPTLVIPPGTGPTPPPP